MNQPARRETLPDVPDQADAYPHYLAGVLSGAGSYYAYTTLKNRNSAVLAGTMALAFGFAGYLVQSGDKKNGYDLGTLASLGLLLGHGPQVYAKGGKDPYPLAMTVGGILLGPWNAMKSYYIRNAPAHVPPRVPLEETANAAKEKMGEMKDKAREKADEYRK